MAVLPNSSPLPSRSRPGWNAFRISVMDRYLIKELIPPFLFGVGAFTSIGVSVDSLFYLIQLITEKGLPVRLAAEVFLLNMPEFIVYAFPMSVLLSTLMTFGRLSSDSEMVALRGCGVGLYRIMVPVLVASVFVTGLTFAFNELITPAANYRAAIALEQALDEERPSFREQNILYQEYREVEDIETGDKDDELARIFYAREFDGQQMQGLTILDFTQNGLNQIISAKSAEWNLGNDSWDFFDGTIYIVSADGEFRNIITFDQQTLQLPRTPLDLAERGRDYGEMNIAQSLDRLDLLQQGAGDEADIRKMRVRIQQKLALPFVCTVFGIVGAALGARSRRTSGRATSFGLSIIIIFGYYLLGFITNAMGITGFLSPFFSAWIPNLLGWGIGGFLVFKASQ